MKPMWPLMSEWEGEYSSDVAMEKGVVWKREKEQGLRERGGEEMIGRGRGGEMERGREGEGEGSWRRGIRSSLLQ